MKTGLKEFRMVLSRLDNVIASVDEAREKAEDATESIRQLFIFARESIPTGYDGQSQQVTLDLLAQLRDKLGELVDNQSEPINQNNAARQLGDLYADLSSLRNTLGQK